MPAVSISARLNPGNYKTPRSTGAAFAAIIAETVRVNGWLIFACHDVAAEPSRFGVTPDLFAFALKTARDAGCQLANVRDALLILRGRVVYPGSEDLG